VRLSSGIAELRDGDDAESLILRADEALYQEKRDRADDSLS
jgi:PleD family two-component response regulator